MNYFEVIRHVMKDTHYEAKPRLCGGQFGFVRHRFPIKGGISWCDALIRSASSPNPLLKMVRIK